MTVAVLAPFIPALFAVHDAGVFELDGNIAKNSGGTLPTDWGALFDTFGAKLPLPSGGIDSGWVNDGPHSVREVTTFSTGSKDVQNINPNPGGWQCGGSNNITPKDDILHAYSFAIKPTDGNKMNHILVYGGFERFSNSGSGDVGFWLFADATVGCKSPTGATMNFNGTHTIGDILTVAEFSTGGFVTTINVIEWVGSTGTCITGVSAGPNLCLLTPSGGGDCAVASSGDNVCGKVNTASIPTPWATQDKTSAANTLATAEFFEVGLDITNLLPSSTGCFNKFLFDTRTSTSTTATLKDFAEGSLVTCGDISGLKFEDVNANGSRDSGEPTLSGWTIKLYDSNNVLVGTQVTNATGQYFFGALSAGTYKICEANLDPTLWTQSFPATALMPPCPADAPNGYTVSLGALSHITGKDFGNFRRGSISGFKFIDANGNGVLDLGEGCPTTSPENAGCAGVTVNLSGTTGMGTPVSTSTTTLADGSYSFTNLIPGTYTVTVAEPTGFQCSFPTPCTYTITIQSAQASSGNGFLDFSNGTISGFKFIDLNNNGVLDPGEGCPAAPDPNHTGCAGVTVNLTGTTGMGVSITRSTTTADDGSYSFTNLPPGTYTITIVEPPGFECSTSPCSHTVTLTSDQIVTFQNFGDVRPIVKITGFSFTNVPTGTITAGIVSGTSTYTFQFTNYGSTTAIVSGTITVTVTYPGAPSGSVNCTGLCSSFGPTSIAPGASAGSGTYTLNYSNLPTGTVVSVTLTATYTTITDGAGSTRNVSGSPATYSFTIQGN